MKELSGELVYKTINQVKKKLAINEVNQLLIGTLKQINDNQIKLDENLFNTIITYFALTLLARVNSEEDYRKIFNECLVGEIKESEEIN